MLFTLGLLLLLTPFPSFQTTISEKKDSTGGNVTKPNAVFTLSKPKTTSTLAKQTVRPTLKPNTHNQTVLPTPATNQKPQTFNSTATTKSKASAAVIQTTPSTVVKAPAASGPITNKDKHTVSVNQTGLNKSPSASELRTSKDKPAPTGAPNVQSTSTRSALASNAKTTKDKLQPFVNQTVSMKSPSTGDGKIAKDKPAPTVVQNVVSTSTKSALANGAKTTKNKPTASVNQTVVVKSPSPSDVKNTKDKTAPNAVQTPLSTPAKAAKASGSAGDKDKVTASANRTNVIKASTTKDKPTPNAVQTPLSTPAKAAKASGSAGDKDKATASANRTTAIKASNTNKDKSAPNAVQTPLSTTAKVTKASGSSRDKDKATASASQTTAIKAPNTNKDKSAPNAVQTPLSTPAKATKASGSAGDKDVASANRTVVVKAPSTTKEKPALTTVQIPPSTPAKATTASGSAADKDEASANRTTVIKAAPSQPIKVVISDGWDSSKAKEQELKLKPGTPLVMTHKISLLSGGCAGECEAEMTTLKERVTRLEREMSLLKEKCSGSANCPDDCSGNGVCENRKCVCHQGFVGPDCSKCAQGAECNKKAAKSKAKETVELVTFQKKESETKETDSKARLASNATPGQVKTQAIQEVSVKKISMKGSSSATKTSRPTVGQVLLKHEGRKQEEVRKGKTTVLTSKKVLQKSDLKLVKQGSVSRTYPKTDHLKDEPHTNVTQVNLKKSNGTAKIVTILSKGMGTNKTRTGKEILEQSTLAEKNITNSSGHKRSKTVKVDTINVQSVHNRNTETGKGKVTQRSQYVVNESIAATSDEARALQNKTTISVSGMSRGTGGSGLGSVKVVNISSYSFTVTWSAPQGMFKNFTVIRREPKTEGDEDDHEEFEEEALEGDKTSTNPTEVQVQTESNNTTVRSGKTVGSVGKAETKRISMVVPGSVRSVEFSNLRANTRYVLHIYGIGAERRSKIHRVTAVTGPEPATEMIFSNVTESSLAVSWSKPKTTFKSFRVTYTNIVTGESRFVVVHSQQSNVVLSKLSAGSSYIVSVTTTQGRTQSDALVSIITTVPAPPTHLQVVNVSDTRAVLQWTPSLGKVDRFIISYESSKTPNVTVTVMLSGNSVEHQLRGLQRGTLYKVKVLSQKDSLQSMAISTTFTTANVVKANEVGARSAVITWKTSTVVYHSYRVVYQVAGEETKEVILDPTITEYKLTGLLPMSRYIVLVQGERDGHYTSVITTEFITGKLRFPFPTECSQELLNGALQSGEVDIYPQGKEGQAVRVYCDMETDGGGWTVFQRRMNGKTDFYRTWSEYRAGFGNLSEEFWLGNEVLHNLTNVGSVSLRVDMQSGNDTAYAHYANFSISSEERHYTLTVSSYTGTAGDSMRYHNGRPFSTRDKDPDSLGIHCSKAYMGGWWYKNCYKTNLNGLYGINSNNQGIVWIDWKGKDSSIPFTEMKFRPSKFSPATHG